MIEPRKRVSTYLSSREGGYPRRRITSTTNRGHRRTYPDRESERDRIRACDGNDYGKDLRVITTPNSHQPSVPISLVCHGESAYNKTVSDQTTRFNSPHADAHTPQTLKQTQHRNERRKER